LGVRLRFVLLFAMGTASIRRGKKHDPYRHLGLSHPAAFVDTNPFPPLTTSDVTVLRFEVFQ
jgi:hypothetical protein